MTQVDHATAARRFAKELTQDGAAERWLQGIGVNGISEASHALRRMASLELPLDLLISLFEQIATYFTSKPGLELAVVQLETFLERVRSPLAMATLFERDAEALPLLLRLLSIDGPLSKIVLEDVESFDVLRLVAGKAISRDALHADLRNELGAMDSEHHLPAALTRFRDREVLRIGSGLLSGEATAVWVSCQLTQLAEVCCSALLEHECARFTKQNGNIAPNFRISCLSKGDCGASVMHFASALDLDFLYESAPTSRNPSSAHAEEANRIATATVNALRGEIDSPYKIQLESSPAPKATHAFAQPATFVLRELDQFGRTWQRMEMLSARCIGGNSKLGEDFIHQLQPWVYRRRLSDADIDGLLFQYRNWRRGLDEITLDGLFTGIRILQLLYGGDHVEVRRQNPIEALDPLASAGAIAKTEARQLVQTLQELFKRRLLSQLGVPDPSKKELDSLLETASQTISICLEKVFGEPPSPGPISDLIMNPLPSQQETVAAMSPLGFEDPLTSGAALAGLAQETSPFLSTRNARHNLAKIGSALAATLARTPAPDHTLLVLSRVVESLGAKGALWELFLANPPSMELCVRLCAYSPYLSNILIASPGFIDELLDSLQLARLPSLSAMESRLDDLCKGAELEQAVHEFKSALHLRIGVRDILDREDIASTHQSLAQTAEAILRRVVTEQYQELGQKHGIPMIEGDAGTKSRTSECRYVLLVSGKIGALEPNYHSEIEFTLIHEADGMTHPESRSKASVSCAHFFSQLTQRAARRLTSRGRLGQLYSVNSEVRPLGPHGPIAASLEALRGHYLDTPRSWRDLLWLTKTRPAGGDVAMAAEILAIFHAALAQTAISPDDVTDFAAYRKSQAEGASPLNLKRAAGGTQHVELLVQFLQLTFAASHRKILAPGTLEALNRLGSEGLLTKKDADFLAEKYRFLRSIESRLRLMNTQARHDLPSNESELRSLAMFVGAASGQTIHDSCIAAMSQVNEMIEAREATLAKELQK